MINLTKRLKHYPAVVGGINLSIRCSNVGALQARLLNIGYELKLETVNEWYRCGSCFVGERHILVMDPDGYLLRFMQSLGSRT